MSTLSTITWVGRRSHINPGRETVSQFPSRDNSNKTLTICGSPRHLILTFVKTPGSMPDSRKNWLAFLFLLCFTWVPAQVTTASIFHLYFFSLAPPFPLQLLHTPHTHIPHLPLPWPPEKNHHVSWNKLYGKKIQTKCSLSPIGALVYPATINYTIYQCVTQCNRAPYQCQSQFLPESVLGKYPGSHIWLYLYLHGRGMGSRWDHSLTFKSISALPKSFCTLHCMCGDLQHPSKGANNYPVQTKKS